MNTSTHSLLDIRFASTKAVAFVLKPAPQAELLEAVRKRLGPTPGIYSAETTLLDLSAFTAEQLTEYGIDLTAFASLFKEAGVHWVELRGTATGLEDQAEALGIRFEAGAEYTQTHAAPQPVETNSEEPSGADVTAAEPTSPENQDTNARKTLVIEQSVRSGQKFYAQGADLVVMGQVSAGAEVIADGNVHVYGVLRGRALAGAAGDRDARIISTCFEPELVAVAGYYLTFEGGFPEDNRSKPTLVYLDQSQEQASLKLKALNIR
ncbi:MAG TPA: septum site-determining protein MinC [Limnobacter sp.]|uniref:septum site-determining protein MinC n=1 Tax=Limnobacter sp. TaxID=2003368 RepID=UPI002ED97155